MVNPNWDHVFFEFLVLKKTPINNTFFSNELIPNITFRAFINALYLEHLFAWTFFHSIWKQRYSFPGGSSVENLGVVVVSVTLKVEEWQIFSRCLIWMWIVIIFAIHITMVVGFLILSRWWYIIFTCRGIWSTSALGLYRSIKKWWYNKSSVWVSIFFNLS